MAVPHTRYSWVYEPFLFSDRLVTVQEKMREYCANGAQLAWLIDRNLQQVEIYRPNRNIEIVQAPTLLLGKDVFPGFVLNFESIW